MTSFGAEVEKKINDGSGPYVFKIFGQISHRIGSLCPVPGSHPRFLQLYIYDSINDVYNRMRLYNESERGHLCVDTVGYLTNMLRSINRYVRLFKTANQYALDHGIDDYRVRLYHGVHDPRYRIPEGNIIGGIIFGDDPYASDFDVIVFSKTGQPHRVSKLHPSYMPMQYPLIFPHGDLGWSKELRLTGDEVVSSKSLTMNMYYSHLCHDRLEFSTIVASGRLFQQFLVDAYVCIEECRLDYIRNNQNDFRSQFVAGIYVTISRGDSEGKTIWKRIFLPSSFVGGPRYMYSHYQDALAICRIYENPQYFITFTCNVYWDEILRFVEHFGVSQAQDRPDIIARLFRIKVIDFISFLKSSKIFGSVTACK